MLKDLDLQNSRVVCALILSLVGGLDAHRSSAGRFDRVDGGVDPKTGGGGVWTNLGLVSFVDALKQLLLGLGSQVPRAGLLDLQQYFGRLLASMTAILAVGQATMRRLLATYFITSGFGVISA